MNTVLLPQGRLLPTEAHSCAKLHWLARPPSTWWYLPAWRRTGSSVIICGQTQRNRKLKCDTTPVSLCLRPQFEESMEPERTVPDLAIKTGGGSPETYKHESSMQDILSEIQSLVEKSNIINVSMSCFWCTSRRIYQLAILQKTVAMGEYNYL